MGNCKSAELEIENDLGYPVSMKLYVNDRGARGRDVPEFGSKVLKNGKKLRLNGIDEGFFGSEKSYWLFVWKAGKDAIHSTVLYDAKIMVTGAHTRLVLSREKRKRAGVLMSKRGNIRPNVPLTASVALLSQADIELESPDTMRLRGQGGGFLGRQVYQDSDEDIENAHPTHKYASIYALVTKEYTDMEQVAKWLHAVLTPAETYISPYFFSVGERVLTLAYFNDKPSQWLAGEIVDSTSGNTYDISVVMKDTFGNGES
uniref:Uncharacterized protein n=1 Tax=Lotharella globosa TaxID=91324 RepID=A0A7S3ZDU7_9EUKA